MTSNLTSYYMQKVAVLPLAAMAIGAGVGALGGMLTKTPNQSLGSAALSGAAMGAIPGGLFTGGAKAVAMGTKALARGKSMGQIGTLAKGSIRRGLAKETAMTGARNAAIGTGIGAGMNLVSGAYKQPKVDMYGAPQY